MALALTPFEKVQQYSLTHSEFLSKASDTEVGRAAAELGLSTSEVLAARRAVLVKSVANLEALALETEGLRKKNDVEVPSDFGGNKLSESPAWLQAVTSPDSAKKRTPVRDSESAERDREIQELLKKNVPEHVSRRFSGLSKLTLVGDSESAQSEIRETLKKHLPEIAAGRIAVAAIAENFSLEECREILDLRIEGLNDRSSRLPGCKRIRLSSEVRDKLAAVGVEDGIRTMLESLTAWTGIDHAQALSASSAQEAVSGASGSSSAGKSFGVGYEEGLVDVALREARRPEPQAVRTTLGEGPDVPNWEFSYKGTGTQDGVVTFEGRTPKPGELEDLAQSLIDRGTWRYHPKIAVRVDGSGHHLDVVVESELRAAEKEIQIRQSGIALTARFIQKRGY